MRRNRKIESEGAEEGGYWIYLAPGWVLDGEDTHAIVEDTRAQALTRLAEVVPCRCAECVSLMTTTATQPRLRFEFGSLVQQRRWGVDYDGEIWRKDKPGDWKRHPTPKGVPSRVLEYASGVLGEKHSAEA